SQAPRHSFHLLESGAHCALAPFDEVSSERHDVLPSVVQDASELLLEQVGAVEGTIGLHQGSERELVPVLEILPCAQEAPLLRLHRLTDFVARSPSEEPPPRLVESLVQPLDDVKSIEHVDSLAKDALRDPHVAEIADHASNRSTAMSTEEPEE